MTTAALSAKRLRVEHHTRYAYTEKVSLSYHQAMLEPRDSARQRVASTNLRVEPPVLVAARRLDYFGNRVAVFEIDSGHETLDVVATSEIDMDRLDPPELAASFPLEEITRRLRKPEDDALLTASEYPASSPLVPKKKELAALARPHFPPGRPYLEGVHGLMEQIHAEFRYDPEVTSVSTPIDDVLLYKHGVCQDFAHVMIGCLRSLGGPARYVSGYLVPLPGVVGAQASHAWVSAYCPHLGWVDFDPTNNVVPTDGHVTLAWGRDFGDVSPLRGVVYGGGEHTVHVAVEIA